MRAMSLPQLTLYFLPFSFILVCQLTMAQKNIIEERNDDGSFTKISKRRVKDLFIEVSSIQSKENGKQQVDDGNPKFVVVVFHFIS